MNKDIQCVFLDTSVLEPYFFSNEYTKEEDEREDEKNSSQKTIKKIFESAKKNPNISVKIPQIVIGELITNYITDRDEKKKFPRNDDEKTLQNLKNLCQKLKAEIVRSNFDSIQIARRLMNDDRFVERDHGNDPLIVGVALSDKNSSHLITRDGWMLESKHIEQIDKNLQDEGKRMRTIKRKENF